VRGFRKGCSGNPRLKKPCDGIPKTHDIHVLRALLPPKLRPELENTIQDRLTQYATVMRYPGAGPDVPLTEARKAVAIARRVRKEVRKHLPRAALRRAR
jgi:HEPN domain-containing protein